MRSAGFAVRKRRFGRRPLRAGLRLAASLAAAWLAHESALAASFDEDVAFLKSHTDLIVLSTGPAKVAVAPAYQGRVMTSTAHGGTGASFGWINRDLIAAHKLQPHINVYGGEDRFWMGPEGGQYSIFFAKGASFDLDHWFTPAPLDTKPFELTFQSQTRAEFHRSFTLTNYSGTRLDVSVNRGVQLLSTQDAWIKLGVVPAKGVDLVAFESMNRLRNSGPKSWSKDTGLLSIWILGMLNPSPATTIVIPIKAGPEAKLGKPVTSDYFGPVPPERLVVQDKAIFFSGDGKFRSKIGINPLRSQGILGSYDSTQKVLTIVQFTLPLGETNYVNSMWQIQTNPYAGDVANSYNDGPPSPGAKPLGPFYEIESSSPAAELRPGKSIVHSHRTMHLSGSEEDLDGVARAVLGVGLQQIKAALPHSP